MSTRWPRGGGSAAQLISARPTGGSTARRSTATPSAQGERMPRADRRATCSTEDRASQALKRTGLRAQAEPAAGPASRGEVEGGADDAVGVESVVAVDVV